MTPYKVQLLSTEETADLLSLVRADGRSLPFFDNKRRTEALFLSDVNINAANVIKQEMLSLGGDAAVCAGAVNCSAKKSDVVLFGSRKQLSLFADKISMMGWWGLTEAAEAVRHALATLLPREYVMELPHGDDLCFGTKTHIMGIVNLTDDSFFSESRTCGSADRAVERALKLAEEGATILDLGAESTRPGSHRVPEEQELERITEAVKKIRAALPGMPLSIDTTRASVAEAAMEAGADIINDVSGLTFDERIADVAARYRAPLVIMHMRGTPETMQSMCSYDNLLKEITIFFDETIKKAVKHGVERSRIILDPGFGFAKDTNQNLFLAKNANAFDTFGCPLLYGVSRKGFIGRITHGEPTPQESLEGTLATTALFTWAGVDIIRVHDVLENVRVVKMTEAIKGSHDGR